jgi:hypothetical protein
MDKKLRKSEKTPNCEMISYAARYCDKYKPDQTVTSAKSTERQEKEK